MFRSSSNTSCSNSSQKSLWEKVPLGPLMPLCSAIRVEAGLLLTSSYSARFVSSSFGHLGLLRGWRCTMVPSTKAQLEMMWMAPQSPHKRRWLKRPTSIISQEKWLVRERRELSKTWGFLLEVLVYFSTHTAIPKQTPRICSPAFGLLGSFSASLTAGVVPPWSFWASSTTKPGTLSVAFRSCRSQLSPRYLMVFWQLFLVSNVLMFCDSPLLLFLLVQQVLCSEHISHGFSCSFRVNDFPPRSPRRSTAFSQSPKRPS